jgi:3-hydroxyacyl-[acyl-carrier-protein] dehydratase
MLKDNFYIIKETNNENPEIIIFKLELIQNHDIYKGHFPGQAVVPGVVSMQIIKELCEEQTDKKLQLLKASNVKFPAPIIPENSPIIEVEINRTFTAEKTHKVNAQIKSGNQIFLKLKALYIETSEISHPT